MKVFHTDAHRKHAPVMWLFRGVIKPSPEIPERAEALLAAAQGGGHEILEPGAFGLDPVAAVHDADYLDFLETAHERWMELPGASAEIIPNAHPGRWPASRPESIVGQVGYHTGDTSCPIAAGTWEAARAATDCALSAAEAVLDGERVAYALCRPPGHHAFADMAGGFCYLNSSAITAQFLRRRLDRIAILDVDVHHGNGTQSIFWRRPDVLCVSIHADPAGYYPFFWGHAHEQGEGEGVGFNLNLPLAVGSGDAAYMPALAEALARVRAFAPDALVVALGLDAHEKDPLQGMALSTGCFAAIAGEIAALQLPTVLVQEGGYPTDVLGDNLASFLSGYEG
jgi:acetoin utilization deacetylase AcuC-like enzyme